MNRRIGYYIRTPEIRRAQSLRQTGQKRNKDWCEAIGRSKRGKKQTPQAIENHRLSCIKHPGNNPMDRYLRKRFGITEIKYREMLESQNGVCAICKNPETSIDKRYNTLRRLAVDHDHETGRVRRLLCHNCNRVLGMIKENPYIVKIMYETIMNEVIE